MPGSYFFLCLSLNHTRAQHTSLYCPKPFPLMLEGPSFRPPQVYVRVSRRRRLTSTSGDDQRVEEAAGRTTCNVRPNPPPRAERDASSGQRVGDGGPSSSSSVVVTLTDTTSSSWASVACPIGGVFDDRSTPSAYYREIGLPAVHSVVRARSGSLIIAYGQSGTGKTAALFGRASSHQGADRRSRSRGNSSVGNERRRDDSVVDLCVVDLFSLMSTYEERFRAEAVPPPSSSEHRHRAPRAAYCSVAAELLVSVIELHNHTAIDLLGNQCCIEQEADEGGQCEMAAVASRRSSEHRRRESSVTSSSRSSSAATTNSRRSSPAATPRGGQPPSSFKTTSAVLMKFIADVDALDRLAVTEPIAAE